MPKKGTTLLWFPLRRYKRRVKTAVKRLWSYVFLLALMICAASLPALAEEDTAEWTVLFYICGSDLESKYAYATGNLQEIATCKRAESGEEKYVELVQQAMGDFTPREPMNVNILIQTGGSTAWHAQELGMDITTDALQRWRYDAYLSEEEPGGFHLEQALPLNSMADPETLTDFIRWGRENYPANKYVLVLWGHGGGAKTGIFVDDLFDGDVLHLDELKSALLNGGTHFEALLFDACMMANLETAQAIQDSADWMIGSEELVAGKGTAVDAWLQELIRMPECDGMMLGRWICDMTAIKYANEDNESTLELMTWSVIDLSKIQALSDYFESSYAGFRAVYTSSPKLTALFTQGAYQTEHYGSGEENMWDLSGILYQNVHSTLSGSEKRWETMKAAMEAVPYSVRGSGRTAARGLSFCYAVDFTPEELDVYARNNPQPNYLALLDAISPWTAPDWVYEEVERLPEMASMEGYRMKVNKVVYDDGTPAFTLVPGYDANVSTVRYTLFYKNERNGRIVSLGTAPVFLDLKAAENGLYRAYKPWLWPSIDGELCALDILNIPTDGNYNLLYNIPIQMNSETWNLRCSYSGIADTYNVYGLWEGFDSDSKLFNRNVRSLSQVAGQEFRLQYAIDTVTTRSRAAYEYSPSMTMYRMLRVEHMPLPEGTYYIEYIIYDIFMRPMKLQRVEVYWDGQQLQVVGDDWNGQETLDIMSYYNSKQ